MEVCFPFSSFWSSAAQAGGAVGCFSSLERGALLFPVLIHLQRSSSAWKVLEKGLLHCWPLKENGFCFCLPGKEATPGIIFLDKTPCCDAIRSNVLCVLLLFFPVDRNNILTRNFPDVITKMASLENSRTDPFTSVPREKQKQVIRFPGKPHTYHFYTIEA